MRDIRPVGGDCVWHGRDMANSPRWQRALSPAQLGEIDRALAAVKARGLRWEEMTVYDFPLPSFAPLADDIRDVYAEAKANGFDTKALRELIRSRKIDVEERKEQEAILEAYLQALGMLN